MQGLQEPHQIKRAASTGANSPNLLQLPFYKYEEQQTPSSQWECTLVETSQMLLEIRRNVPWTHAAKSEYCAEDRNEHFKDLTKHTTTMPGRSTCNLNWTEVY